MNNTAGFDPVTHALVQACVRELAMIIGRTPLQVLQASQKRPEGERTRDTELDELDAMLDALSERRFAGPVSGPTSLQAPTLLARHDYL